MSFQRLTYASTVFLSSALLFLVQPIVARAILPAFGGTAAVWTTCMLFFQVVLVVGYLYAHLLTTRVPPRLQAVIHCGLLVLSLVLLRGGIPVVAAGSGSPLWQILGLLQVSVGLPYQMLSTTGPLVQSWYARTVAKPFPYRLFALSNAASLAALISYPIVWEPLLTLHAQISAWSAGYVAFAVLAGTSAWLGTRRVASPIRAEGRYMLGSFRTAALWMLLAFCPSVLWLAVANHLSQSVAAIPFLWVLPLSIYLLSFVLTFQADGWYLPRRFRWFLPVAWAGLILGLFGDALGIHFKWLISIYCVGLSIVCLFCHGELARRKPDPSQLTAFYLCVAIGGALGSVFVALIAPVIFSQYLELPLAIGLAIVLGAILGFQVRSRAMVIRIVGTAAAAVLASVLIDPGGKANRIQARNFYGALRVQDQGSVETAYRSLYNGTVLHGVQWLSPTRSRWTTTYYGTESAVGRLLDPSDRLPMRIGVIGLGVGTVAAYGRPGDYFRFYDINPLVIRVAENDFRYLAECPGRVDVIEGDARLSLEREPPQNFDVLVVDAFAGDSIPVHLLTREAFAVYRRHLAPSGTLAIHITNRYVDLAGLLGSTARALNMESVLVTSSGDVDRKTSWAKWVLMGPPGGSIERAREFGVAHPLEARLRVWTDDFHNLFQVLE